MAAPAEAQIPWAHRTKVTDASPYHVTMEIPGIEAEIDEFGEVQLTIDSREHIGNHMEKSRPLTKSLRKYLEASGSYFLEGTHDWLKGETVGDEEAERFISEEGVLGWWPDFQIIRERIGKEGGHRSGTTREWDDWIGSSFPFVHFVMKDASGIRTEGLAIDWVDKRGVEVWLGDVDGFLSSQAEQFYNWETYYDYNHRFENGLLWALDFMEVFTKPTRRRGQFPEDSIKRPIPNWVVKAIEHDPDLLWPELVEKLLPIKERLPQDLEKAVLTWVDRRRRELEKEVGQGYIWPPEEVA